MTEKLTGTIVSVSCGGSCGVVNYIEPNTHARRSAVIDDHTEGRNGLVNRLGGKLKVGTQIKFFDSDTELLRGERRLKRVI